MEGYWEGRQRLLLALLRVELQLQRERTNRLVMVSGFTVLSLSCTKCSFVLQPSFFSCICGFRRKYWRKTTRSCRRSCKHSVHVAYYVHACMLCSPKLLLMGGANTLGGLTWRRSGYVVRVIATCMCIHLCM